MDKRMIVKMIAKTVVTTAAGSILTKALVATVPATQKFKFAEMVGGVGGWLIGEQLDVRVNDLIDDWFDRREASKF